MTFEQLRIFIAVAERLHMTQAAAALNLTQSAASAAIRALEQQVGLALFDRVGRRIELTEAGRVLLPEARAVLQRLDQAVRSLDDLSGLIRGQLVLYASQTIAGYWLPGRMHRFHQIYPGIALSLVIGNTAQVAAAVVDGAADLGFVEGDVADPLLGRVPVAVDRLVLIAAAGHPWAARRVIDGAELATGRWVLRERGSGTRQVFESALARSGIDPASLPVVLELPSNEAVRAAVAAGAGVTVISRLVAASGLATGALVEVPTGLGGDALERRFTALLHGDRHRSRAMAAFLALLGGPDTRAEPAPVDQAPPPRAGDIISVVD